MCCRIAGPNTPHFVGAERVWRAGLIKVFDPDPAVASASSEWFRLVSCRGREPSGTVTFLFTDIEGSTGLWEERPDEMQVALARHDEVLRSAIEASGGYVFAKTGGDGFVAAFHRPDDAVEAAVASQVALARQRGPAGVQLRVRMGIHTGSADERGGDYFGQTPTRAARIMAAGWAARC